MPRGRPKTVRDVYIRIKLQKDTHHLWAERKTTLRLKSDDELARHLLSSCSLPTAGPTAAAVTQVETPQATCNENLHEEWHSGGDSLSTEQLLRSLVHNNAVNNDEGMDTISVNDERHSHVVEDGAIVR